MNISEANMWARIRQYLMGEPVEPGEIRNAVIYLSQRSHMALHAGPTGIQIAEAWPLDAEPLDRPIRRINLVKGSQS